MDKTAKKTLFPERLGVNLAETRRFGHFSPSPHFVEYLPFDALRERGSHQSIDIAFFLAGDSSGFRRSFDGHGVQGLRPPFFTFTMPGVVYDVCIPRPLENFYLCYDAEHLAHFSDLAELYPDHAGELGGNAQINRLIHDLLERMAQIALPGNSDRIDRLAEMLVEELRLAKIGGAAPSASDAAVNRSALFMGKHYRENISVATLAQQSNLSVRSFSRAWKRLFNISPGQYLIQRRLDAARLLLGEPGERSVKEVSGQVGIDDPLYFSRLFKKHLGLSPQAYRRELLTKMEGT